MQPVTLSGIVTPFAGNGRQFGYPTANITTDTDLADGVYFGYATLASYTNNSALIFIGIPETVGDTERRVEVHLFDIPDVDYYQQSIEATIQYYHRGNKKFDSVEALLAVMKDDERAARAWFTQNPLA